MKKKIIIVLSVVFLLFFGFSSYSLFSTQPSFKEGVYRVTKVIDGDTVSLETGEKVRYLGIDTPEINKLLGREAKQFNEELVLNKKVIIELDQTKYDTYGRVLGYVWIDNILVNEALINQGYTKVYLMRDEPKLKYLDLLLTAQDRAKQNHLGVWSDDYNNKGFKSF